jgi:Co/Zn/Cd efflux system component
LGVTAVVLIVLGLLMAWEVGRKLLQPQQDRQTSWQPVQ